MQTVMTVVEMLDYVKSVDLGGITLTDNGREAAKTILEQRLDWTDAHKHMLDRLERGEEMLPHKLVRLVVRTRLGDALELAREVYGKHLKNQKNKNRRKAAKARAAA